MFKIEKLNGKSYRTLTSKRTVASAFDALMAAGRQDAGTFRIKLGTRVVAKYKL